MQIDDRRLAVQAYQFLFPLVSMEAARLREARCVAPNTLWHDETGDDPCLRTSTAWLDLTDGPVVVSSDGTHGRYHLLSMVDMWREVFAAPGTRTTGNGHGAWAVVPPGWHGYLPPVVRRVDSPTRHVWLRGSIEAGATAGRAPVQHVQQSLHLTTLARWMLPSFHADDRHAGGLHAEPPLPLRAEAMPGELFFATALRLLAMHPVRPQDAPVLARLERLGLVPGADLDDLTPAARACLAAAPATARHVMRSAGSRFERRVHGWRAVPGVDLPEDVTCLTLDGDPEGGPLLGSRSYVLHLPADRLPPVDAFWSVTVQDDDETVGVVRGGAADGPLTLRLEHDEPGTGGRGQWLPTPAGRFSVRLRLYSPRPEVLDGAWTPPTVRRAPAALTAPWTGTPASAGAAGC